MSAPIHVTVNAPTEEVAVQIVSRQLARDGRVGFRVVGAIAADEQLPNSQVALFTTVPGKTHVVVVERPDRPVVTTKRTCPECGRVFDLTDATDADEAANGHDCEAS